MSVVAWSGSYKMSNKRLLAVLAHPDDESFGMGGTLAWYAQQGVEAHLVCATRGEAGLVDEHYLAGFNSIAEVRENELCCAVKALGLAGVHFLDYRDSGMAGSPDNRHPQALAAQPLEEVAARVAHYIRKLQPQVVLTFDPIGGYRHPDHIAIHQATVLAFTAASDPSFQDALLPYQPQKLYFQTIPRRWLRWVVRAMPIFGQDPRRWGRNQDIDLLALVVDDFPVHAVIDYRSVFEHKRQASLCHASQGGAAMQRGLMGWVMRLAGSRENYMRAIPAASPQLREQDLFEGVDFAI